MIPITMLVSSRTLLIINGVVFIAASFLSARRIRVAVCPFRAAWSVRGIMSVRMIGSFVPTRSSMIVIVVIVIVPVLPAMLVMFVVPVVPVMMRFVVMRFFRPLLLRFLLLLRLRRRRGIRSALPEFLTKSVFPLGHNRSHSATAEQAEAAR